MSNIKVPSYYHEEKDKLENEKKKIERQIQALINEVVSESPFKIGDKVKVTERNLTERICFIGNVNIDWRGNYQYKLNKVKKDGTMSGQSDGSIWIDTIFEKID